ncbi:tripartite tricarboxylate transporter substrate binding protein [Pigmentiphaga soli]|uniref:Tripartite tricarboxylate transporter substrate binding protein n=1 Tax=Pigmentiphaga soli TaxID=1007095 RepID=A0ABP8HHR7_9BURK
MFKAMVSRVALGSLLAAAATGVQAGNGPHGYPKDPVRFIVAFAPGGGTDIVARLVAAKLSERIGQQVVVENRAGASGILAAQFVARSEPDGQTLLIGGSGPMVFNPITYNKLPYDPVKDFEPITILGSYPIVLLANPKLPVSTLPELIAYARKNPGTLNYGSAGASFQVPTEYFASQAKITLSQIPYKGTALAGQALMAGDIQLLSADIAPAVPLVNSGQAKALAVTSAKRNPILPQVPSIAESGIKGFDFSLFSAAAAPKGTSREIVTYLQEQIHAVLHSDEISGRLAKMGVEPEGGSPEETAARFKREIDLFRPIADAAGIKVD